MFMELLCMIYHDQGKMETDSLLDLYNSHELNVLG